MYWPDTGTGVDTEPARKPVASAVRKYFTEGGAGVPPTVPGGDWFNAITNEVLNVLAAAGIDPSKTNDDQLLQAIQWLSSSAESLLRQQLAAPGGSGLVGGQPVFVTAEKYAGGATTTSANNDAAIIAAIADAAATGSYVYWPEVYEVQGNITGFHTVRHDGPGGIKRGTDTFQVHQLEWNNNTIYVSPTGSDSNDGLTSSLPLGTVQRAMDVLAFLGAYGAVSRGSWKFKFLPGTFTEGGNFSGFVPSYDYVTFEGSLGLDGLPDVVISGSGSTKTAGLYFFNGPSLIKVDSIACDDFRANSVASGMVFYGKGISEAYTINCAGKNNIWSGINADSIGRWLLTGGTFDANTQYNLRARGGVAIAIGINGTSNKVKLKNNQTAAQIRDGCTGHFDNFEITNDPSLPVGTGVWVANCARVTFNAGSFTNVNLGSLASENATISIGDDVTFTNVNTKYRTENNGTVDSSPTYPDGQGLGFDAFRNEYSVGQYGYTGLRPASSSSAYAFYSTRAGVVDYSFLVNAAARQRMIFGYGSTTATRDKFVVDFNAGGNREDHYIDGGVCLRIKTGAVTSGQDNVSSSGEGGVRWSVVYAATGTINTSDAREKTPPKAIDDAILDAADDVNIVLFKWLNSIATKGDDAARWHFGVIAQQLRDAFLAHGVDGTKYGLLCYDEWEDEFEAVTEEYEQEVATVKLEGGQLVEVLETQILSRETGEMRKVRTAGNRWGVRPDQCMWLMLSAERRRTAAAIARIDSIEQRLSSAGM